MLSLKKRCHVNKKFTVSSQASVPERRCFVRPRNCDCTEIRIPPPPIDECAGECYIVPTGPIVIRKDREPVNVVERSSGACTYKFQGKDGEFCTMCGDTVKLIANPGLKVWVMHEAGVCKIYVDRA